MKITQTQRLERALQKAKQPSLAELKKKVQRIVNAYVRERDKDLPCISCQKYCPNPQAGHYIAQGSSGSLRFNLMNINNQCAGCNIYKHGNLILYRIGLISKIGEERVQYLENHMHDMKKWTREELEEKMTLK